MKPRRFWCEASLGLAAALIGGPVSAGQAEDGPVLAAQAQRTAGSASAARTIGGADPGAAARDQDSAERGATGRASDSGFSADASRAPSAPGTNESPLGIETSATFPFVHIYSAQAAIKVFDRDRVLLGAAYQNWRDDDFGGTAPGTAHAATLLVGYRLYFWKGAHIEVELYPAYNHLDSKVNGRRYSGWELWSEERIGYQFDFELGGVSLYVIPQPGIGHALWLQKIWPGLSRDTLIRDSLVFVPQIMIGAQI